MTAVSSTGPRQPARSSLPGLPIRSILILAFVFLTALPVGIAGYSAASLNSRAAEAQVLSGLNGIADSKADSLSNELGHLNDEIGFLFADSASRAQAMALLSDSSPENQTQINVYLSELLDEEGSFTEYFLFSTEGEILASTDENQIGKIVTRTPYFEASLREEHLQPPYYELGSATLSVVISHPLMDDQGRTRGVVAGRLNLDRAADLMAQRAGLGQTGEAYLVSLENSYFVTPSRYEGFSLTRSYHSVGIDEALAGRSGSGTYTSYRDVEVIGAYRWLPELQGALVVEIERDEALAAVRQTTLTNATIAVIAALLATATGLMLAIRISNPVGQLTEAARRIADGALDERVAIRARNELGVLGDAFNTMTSRLQETIRTEQIARREAQEASRAKDLFLATMSHELRTPLNAIIGFLSLMMVNGDLTEDDYFMAERSAANSNRLLNLINTILDLSRISAGSLEIIPVPMSVQHLANSLENDLALQFKEKGLEFRVSVDERFPATIMHDEERLYQIAANLVGNALKFTDSGHIALDFRLRGDQLTLTCTDTGIGIPKAKQQIIFDEFQQVDGSSTRSHGGAGLGLAIVRKLAILMRGSVRVESIVGQGSKFTVDLPLHLGPEAEPMDVSRQPAVQRA